MFSRSAFSRLPAFCFILNIPIRRNLSTSASAFRYFGPVDRLNPVLKMINLEGDAAQIFKDIISTPEMMRVKREFDGGGYEIRIAGGAVRDIVSGIVPHDVDIATTATPDQMLKLLENKENIRLITTRAGERHGTITVRVNDTNQYEVTTLRIDRITDGRHAEVEFTTDWKIDASRRDLTINAMFLDFKGVIHDYFSGVEDLRAKRIRFVGSPPDRILEDYLRIYRYFRFFARYATGPHDADTMAAMAEGCSGLERISGERKWSELKRILATLKCNTVIPVMLAAPLQLGRYMGMDISRSDQAINEFNRVHANLVQVNSPLQSQPDSALHEHEPATLFASLIGSHDEAVSISQALKLSNADRDLILYIVNNRQDLTSITEHDLRTILALAPGPQQEQLRKFSIELLRYGGCPVELMQRISVWPIPQFPIKGNIIGERVKQRRMIGKVMEDLKRRWAENEFHDWSDTELRAILDELIETKYSQPSGDQPVN